MSCNTSGSRAKAELSKGGDGIIRVVGGSDINREGTGIIPGLGLEGQVESNRQGKKMS